MRYALIIAGGSGTRLWPMSTRSLPKQLIPFIDGRSLLQIAMDRLEGMLPQSQVYICAGEMQRRVMIDKLPGLTEDRFIGEPMGRDTLNAVALGTGVLHRRDPDAVVAVFTADHLIEPVDKFQRIVDHGYRLAEQRRDALVTFGIEPTHPATGYGYLELGAPIHGEADEQAGARVVNRFREKPDEPTAKKYHQAGPERYLWNSGMFVWRAQTLMNCVEKYAPENHGQISEVLDAWDNPTRRGAKLTEIYPQLEKISVDYAVMEPASEDPDVTVAAIPMPLRWLDVGSWPSFAATRRKDSDGNTAAGCKAVMMDTTHTLVASDEPGHVVATLGCDNLIIIHTAEATLVCHADHAERIKELHKQVGQQHGEQYL